LACSRVGAGCVSGSAASPPRGWIASDAVVTIKTYARRYGVDRYTAHEDLTAIGFPLPASA
jgi:hypothetical protein